MLLVLITVLSPISWFYYGVWLLYPIAIVAQFIGSLPKASVTKKIAIAGLAACLLLLNAVLPCLGPVRAVGMPFFGYLLLLIELGWILRRASARIPEGWRSSLDEQIDAMSASQTFVIPGPRFRV
jgi:hypothetical protein